MTSTASIPVDMELKKAFQELQVKMISTTQQLKVADMQIDQLKRQITHAKLVETELDGLPESTKVYQGVGRMFVLQPMDVVKTGLGEKKKTSEEKIKTIENNKVYLEKNLKESEANIREMITSKQRSK